MAGCLGAAAPPGDVWHRVEKVRQEILSRPGARQVGDAEDYWQGRRYAFDVGTAGEPRTFLLWVWPAFGRLFATGVIGPRIDFGWAQGVRFPLGWRLGEPPSPQALPGALLHWSDFREAADGEWQMRHGFGTRNDAVRGYSCAVVDKPEIFWSYNGSKGGDFAAGGTFTIAVWVRTWSARGAVFSQRHSRDVGPMVNLVLSDGRPTASVRGDGAGEAAPAEVRGHAVNDGVWHHLTLTRAADGTVELFIDGASQGRDRAAHSADAITTDLRAVAREPRRALEGGGPSAWPYRGHLEDFVVYGRRLSDAEVRLLAGIR
jgi:hypothetical protein